MHQIAASFIFLICLAQSVIPAYVKVSQNGPGVLGSTIFFRAELFDDQGVKQVSDTTHKFTWSDNAMPPHKYTEQGEFSTSLWNVTYKAPKYSPGEYEIEVRVMRWVGFFFWDIASTRIKINTTVFLNGDMELIQNKTILGGNFVSNQLEVLHKVQLSSPDAKLLSDNETIVTTYWFLGCSYYGSSSDFSFSFNYTQEDLDKTRYMRALVVAGKEGNNNTIEENTFSGPVHNNRTDPVDTTVHPDHNCEDFPVVPIDPNQYYGYFKRQVIPTAPVRVDPIQGETWLEKGQVLNLTVTCSGSSPFYHCVRFFPGEYNITGNETCSQARLTPNCRILFTRLMNTGTKYTVLFIIGNRVSKTVTPVGVTRYSEKHHPQLSVIIVPISCCAVAMVLVVFGVAYYIQRGSRYSIEVADFDFSRASDTEYKTFRERLRDAMSSAFASYLDEYSDEGPTNHNGGGSVWTPTRKNRPPREGGLLYESSDSDH